MSHPIKYTCSQITPSGCVLYTGTIPSFVEESSLPCAPNIDLIFQKHATEIERLISQIDLTALNKRCLDFDPETVTVHALFQEQIDKVCELETALDSLQNIVDNWSIGQQHVTLDLKCMKPATNPCGLDTNTYTLYAVLNILVKEICNIKTQLA